jgi:hypothetical protein
MEMSISLKSAMLEAAGFRHGFFMRRGGVSPPPWESLNLSSASGDDPARVAENLERVAAELGVASERIYYLSQVHGADVRVLDGSEARERLLYQEGDITLSRAPGVGCAVRMADCAAVLIADRASGAVAAVHSGWRGTVQRAVASAIRSLREGGRGELVAAIGPHIERCCFEVGPDVADQIAAACSAPRSEVVVAREPRPHVDLRRVLESQLSDEGVAFESVAGCTMCDAERFHSYRREGPRSGRMMAVIVARSATPERS